MLFIVDCNVKSVNNTWAVSEKDKVTFIMFLLSSVLSDVQYSKVDVQMNLHLYKNNMH